jgi:hypothetical protein
MNTTAGAWKIFSVVFGVVYTLAYYFNWPVVTYYPAIREWHVHVLSGRSAGPAMFYYGWMSTAGLAAALLAFLMPRRFAEWIPSGAIWAVPVMLVVFLMGYEKHWFF